MQPKQHGRQADAAYGAILGACVGDAAGAVLEFLGRKPLMSEVQAALEMPGGGCWGVGAGQVTDDSEMALCLMQALMHHPASSAAPLDDIAAMYIRWLNSPPFDIGRTTRNALQAADDEGISTSQHHGLAAQMIRRAAEMNITSLSNGCLMRIMPMAVWTCRQPAAVVAANAAADTSLTHPHPTAQVAAGAYCIAIAHLIIHSGDAAGAIQTTQDWLHRSVQQPQPHFSHQGRAPQGQQTGSYSANCGQQGVLHNQQAAVATVSQWLSEALQGGAGPAVCEQEGFMKWGFVHAFRSLHLQLSYVEAITQVLLLGGDTDTNAAIVGGMMGALWGASAIPEGLTAPVLQRDVGSPGRQRPRFLQTKQLPQLFDQLWAASSL